MNRYDIGIFLLDGTCVETRANVALDNLGNVQIALLADYQHLRAYCDIRPTENEDEG